MTTKTTTQSQPADQHLLKAFQLFRQQCERLEDNHQSLRRQLDQAHSRLEEQNRELAHRIQETEEVKARLADILDSITDAVFLVNGDGHPTPANPAANRVLTDTFTNYATLEEVPEFAELFTSLSPQKAVEINVQRDGQEQHFMLSVAAMTKEKKHWVIVMREVTDHRRLLQRVARQDRMATLGQVAASVAHEVRNPLNAIDGFASLLMRDLEGQPDAHRLAEKTVQAARRLNEVVSNLLTYTREMRVGLCRSELNMVVERALDLVQPLATARTVTIVPTLPTTPVTILLDPILIGQVLTNLIANSIEACPPSKGRVEIIVTAEAECVRIMVQDNGCGISESITANLFDPFFTTKDLGLGLGLALSRRIIDAHNGWISATSPPTGGACFIVELPYDNAMPSKPARINTEALS